MFCDHSQRCRQHKTAGQDVFLEYRRHAKTFHQAWPDALNFVRTKFSCHSDRGQYSQSAGVCIWCKTAAPDGPASAYNLQFSAPLDENEVNGIAKSIAKWASSKLSEESFSHFVKKTHT